MMTFILSKRYFSNKKNILFSTNQENLKNSNNKNIDDGVKRSRNCEKVSERYDPIN
jgi:hypothetical protein